MSLKDAFQVYVGLLQLAVASAKHSTKSKETTERLNIINFRSLYNLRNLVEDLESKAEFQTLIRETALNFSKEPYKESSLGDIFWRSNVETFFRRSGLYFLAYKEERQDANAIFTNYIDAFEKKAVRIKHLVPLEFVGFDESLMDFGSFRIVRLSRSDLESLLQNEINRVFYPYAYANLSNLDGLWFLEVNETINACEPGSGGLVEFPDPEVEVRFTTFPLAVENALEHLALYKWETSETPWSTSEKSKRKQYLEADWERFYVPFIMSITDSLLESPRALSDLSILAREPEFNPEGEEIGDRPIHSIYVEAYQFNPEMQRIAKSMTELKEKRAAQWNFLDLALGYLTKAFFANDLDQLLWHMVAMESLLGDKGDSADGLTKRLMRRVAFIVSKNEKEKAEIKKLVRACRRKERLFNAVGN